MQREIDGQSVSKQDLALPVFSRRRHPRRHFRAVVDVVRPPVRVRPDLDVPRQATLANPRRRRRSAGKDRGRRRLQRRKPTQARRHRRGRDKRDGWRRRSVSSSTITRVRYLLLASRPLRRGPLRDPEVVVDEVLAPRRGSPLLPAPREARGPAPAPGRARKALVQAVTGTGTCASGGSGVAGRTAVATAS